MSNTSKYVKGAVSGAADGVKAEWERRQTLGRVVEAIFVPAQTLAVNNAARMVVAVSTGAYKGVRTVGAEVAAVKAAQAVEQAEVAETIAGVETIRVVPADVRVVPNQGGRHRAENQGA